jgi:hypothetical protein
MIYRHHLVCINVEVRKSVLCANKVQLRAENILLNSMQPVTEHSYCVSLANIKGSCTIKDIQFMLNYLKFSINIWQP